MNDKEVAAPGSSQSSRGTFTCTDEPAAAVDQRRLPRSYSQLVPAAGENVGVQKENGRNGCRSYTFFLTSGGSVGLRLSFSF